MSYPEKLKDGFYHVKDGEKEIGKYKTLSGARKQADAHEGSAVYTENGEQAYPAAEQIEGQTSGISADTAVTGGKIQTAVLTTLMNVRRTPGLNGEIITTAKAGTEVSVQAVEGDWLKVEWEDGIAYILYEAGKYAVLK